MFFYTFMPGLFNMSLTASIAIVFVLLLRLLLKKTPKLIPYLLWAVVLFRLLCPVSIGSSLSLYNLFDTPAGEAGTTTSAIEYVPTDIVHQPDPAVALPLPGINEAINEILPQGEEQLRADPLEGPIFIITCIWMTGLLVMVLYSIVSYIRLLHKLSVVVPLRDNIFIADDIKSPFVVGLFSPKIYLPCNLTEKEQAYIILHEQHHIKRLDHITKALAFSALAIHWFNPLVWIAFILAGKDMEMSCDEAVIRKIGGDVRAEYSASLLTLATGRRIIAGTPLAFGEGDTKGRINNLSKWKKPALWGIVVAVLACAILAVCVLTNPLAELALGDIESVTADTISVSDEAAAELVSLINSHHCAPFLVGLDEPNSLSRAIQLNCANGDFYLLHYQYYSGLSFEPPHSGEDDFRSILTYFTSNGGAQKAWKMEYDFDAKLKEWLSKYSSPNFGAFLIDQPYGVMELTFESGSTSIAQVSTPEYMIDKNKHLFSVKEYSAASTWTDLGELSETAITKENFDELFRNDSEDGWFGQGSAAEIRKNTVQAWRVIYNQEGLYYILQQNNGELYLAHGYYDYSEKEDPGSDDSYIRRLYKLAPQSPSASSSVSKWFDYLAAPNKMHWDGPIEITLPEFPDVVFRCEPEKMEAIIGDALIPLYSGMPIWNCYFCDITGDGFPELCSTVSWGSGMIDNRVIIYDHANGVSYSLKNRGASDYMLRQNEKDGRLYVDKRAPIGGELLSTGPLLFKDGHLQLFGETIAPLSIGEVTDPTDDPNFSYDTAVEIFFEDESNEYYFGGLYSQDVIVHYTDGTQEDIETALKTGRATIDDLDKFGIRYWAEPKAGSLEAAISSAILDHYASDKPNGLIHVESHVLLANEAISGTPLFGADDHAEQITTYLLVHHVKYSTYGGTLEAVGGSYVPTAITFKITASGEYVLEEYWEPRDGAYYVKDIRDKFPSASADDALNDQAYIEDLKAETYNKALAYQSTNPSLDVRIAKLLDTLHSAAVDSSKPLDQLREHEGAYEELLSYGKYTLHFCFSEFLMGGQADLRGQIMSLACQDIMLAWGEAYIVDWAGLSGQDWFAEFRSNAESLSDQINHEELEKMYPAAFLLLQMSDSEFMTKPELG